MSLTSKPQDLTLLNNTHLLTFNIRLTSSLSAILKLDVLYTAVVSRLCKSTFLSLIIVIFYDRDLVPGFLGVAVVGPIIRDSGEVMLKIKYILKKVKYISKEKIFKELSNVYTANVFTVNSYCSNCKTIITELLPVTVICDNTEQTTC